MQEFFQNWEAILLLVGAVTGTIIIGLAAHMVVFHALQQIAKRTATVLDASIYRHCRRPAQMIMPLLLLRLALPVMPVTLSPAVEERIGLLISILLIMAFAWLFIRLTSVLEDFILSRYKLDVQDNLEARKIYTQMDIIRKIVILVIAIVTLAVILMSFENFRQIGVSILASAGIAGLVIGLAAQKTLANMLAGIQIAITQPIRIDDVVIVENEWGRIEEINLTYVVVAIWDKRRLVLPISYFIERPFQNWTRVSADILGTVLLYVDYTVPIEEIRRELRRVLEESEYWDGDVCGLVVTDAKEQTLELRALMSAPDSGAAWNLRCEVREKLIVFVQKNYPQALPKVRAELVEAKPISPAPAHSLGTK